MEKQKLITFSIVALLLLNIGTLGFLFATGPKHGDMPSRPHGRPEPREIIIEKLHFDEQQQAQYVDLIQEHRHKIEATEDKIREAKNELYLLLNQSNSTQKDSLIALLANYQKEIETSHFEHFTAIKKLCHKEQLADFEDLTAELSRIFSRPPRPRHDE